MNNQYKTPLFDAIKDYHRKQVIPFDVPGHKHGRGIPELAEFFGNRVLEVDVNSMEMLDNIGSPSGVIKEAEKLMADAYRSDHAFLLVNGTSSGVQAMVMSVCNPGEKIIMPRNAHKSAINSLILSGAVPVYVQPETDEKLGIAMGVSVESVEKAIAKNPDAKAVFLINPTYYGVTSNLKDIIKVAHKNGMAVVVDEAHGAHLGFHKELPCGAMELGADMAAVSLHKTGGSLTQSSVLLLNEGFVDKNHVRAMLNLTQTTSASYLLMTSLDIARKILATRGEEIFTRILKLTRMAREEINKIEGLYAFGKELIGNEGVFDFDETKLGINVSGLGMTGFKAYDILRDEYNIQVELGDVFNVLAIVSVGDDEESIRALIEALKSMSKKYRGCKMEFANVNLENPEVIVSPRDAFYASKKLIKLEDAEGEISGESIMAYPPGIPIVTPGERISKDMIEYIRYIKSQHSMLTDTEDPQVEYIKVLGI
ncbi:MULTISPECIES: aminotransferase class I/II-fold pyridoxal phosphate-dependent enzyme [Clostridium]|uniref:Arginine decarboxylase n=2 Tax=Clostridium TaxID=1485 RepID=A0A151AM16_9CLOT|nr:MULTISPECIES: aminotransferase class I/II-fold pyridoxal phosphate-dependent enzyme [Clostridium]KYH28679.1 arginine decarboxylase [Clostridium colicanis DSM 13634]MBE6044983.1 aminotransferase class I/II-fold pyridoxal phosphate-dependent enzyme [Clostridium thermopalmarium]PRR73385.1 Arginine decarboxylase [Clostridium thermopalmarium DSM 5974]PVZ22129.1 arginine/lysine/ornithine decarboxylase [Clostridium thermopalmarium DSM 5974]